jgi:hypothetical protein
MLYAILAYHEEAKISSLTSEGDAALMSKLLEVQAKMVEKGTLGSQVRLGATKQARTVRANGIVLDGPFAETKEHLLGFYVADCDTIDAAIAIARDLQRVNPTAVYEIRPVSLYVPGAPMS